MHDHTQTSVNALRDSLRSRKANADAAFQTFKLQEIVKELPVIELAQAEGWQSPGLTPAVKAKPRGR
jgi:hypothetical protein